MKKINYFFCTLASITSSVHADCGNATVICNLTDSKTTPTTTQHAHTETVGCSKFLSIGSCTPIHDSVNNAIATCKKQYGGVAHITGCSGAATIGDLAKNFIKGIYI